MNINRSTIYTGIMTVALTVSMTASAVMTREVAREASAVRVDLSAINLDSSEGQAKAYARLRHAARDVCGNFSVHDAGSVRGVIDRKHCYQQSLEKAVKRLGNEGVARIHQES